jgi:hypothetical protein
VAGTIKSFHFQNASVPGSNKTLEFSLFTKSGTDYTNKANTNTGSMTFLSGTAAECHVYASGIDFPAPSAECAVGDYVGCFYSDAQEVWVNGA